MPTTLELVLRILLAGALGAAIGYERDRQLRPAGLRTHLLVAMASAAFMVVSTIFASQQEHLDHGVIKVDASRIASEVVSGAGFIAGGAILRSGPTVQGLTTAAGLWLVTAIGLAAGSGMFAMAAIVTALGMLSLWGLRFLSSAEMHERSKVSLALDREASFATLRALIERADTRILTHDYRRAFDTSATEVSFFVTHGSAFDPDALVRELSKEPGLLHVQVEKLA